METVKITTKSVIVTDIGRRYRIPDHLRKALGKKIERDLDSLIQDSIGYYPKSETAVTAPPKHVSLRSTGIFTIAVC